MVYLTNFWCLLTQSTTLEILWTLKHKKKITKIKNQTCVSFAFLLGLKRAIGLKSCFGGAFDNPLVFVDQNYHTGDTFDAKTQKADYEDQKPNFQFFCVSF